jgi:hypothetical protein
MVPPSTSWAGRLTTSARSRPISAIKGAPRQVIDAALDAFDAVDALVVNHAHSA